MNMRKKFFTGGGGFVFNHTFSANSSQFNLRAAALAAGWDGTTRLIANITVLEGVVVYGGTSVFAFDTGSNFPQGTLLTLVNRGSILGVGGGGGVTGVPGNPGGPGLRAQYPIEVHNFGVIAGGGGGGGAGGYVEAWSNVGGAQQIIVGVGGTGGGGAGAGGSASPTNGTSGGYAERGVTFVRGGDGGRGGDPGLAGSPGAAFSTNGSVASSVQPTAGGAPGIAVSGGEFIKWVEFGNVVGKSEYGTNSVIPTPAATPAIGAAFQGGFYAETIWAEVAKIEGVVRASTLASSQELTFYIDGMLSSPLFYIGQQLRVSSASSPTQGINAVVTGTASSTVSLAIGGDASSINGKSDVYLRSRYRIIVSGKAGEVQGSLFSSAQTIPNECLTLTNGNIATKSIEFSHLAQAVRDLSIGGYTDWYIGSRDEMELAYRSFKPVTEQNYGENNRAVSSLSYATLGGVDRKGTKTGLNMELSVDNPQSSYYQPGGYPVRSANVAFRTGGAEALSFGSAVYLSSTKFSDTEIWGQMYVTGEAGRQVPISKDANGYVRAIRRSII